MVFDFRGFSSKGSSVSGKQSSSSLKSFTDFDSLPMEDIDPTRMDSTSNFIFDSEAEAAIRVPPQYGIN